MMGGFQSKRIRRGGGRAFPARPGLALVAALATVAGAGIARTPFARAEERPAIDEGPVLAAPNPAAQPAQPMSADPIRNVSVETEPDLPAALPSPRRARPMQVVVDNAPLTRAAARRRVETLSPVPWLERWGAVSAARRD